MFSFSFFNTETSEQVKTREAKRIEIEKACGEAEKAAWAAKPKTYRLKPLQYREKAVQKKNNGRFDLGKIKIDEYAPENRSASQSIKNSNTCVTTEFSIEKIPLANNNRPARFFTFGCQGNGGEAQLKVAESMNRLLGDPDFEPPDFILVLGDNVYDYGAASPNDEMFKSNFYKIYSRFEHLRKIPFFVLLGNHDENLHSKGALVSEKGIERGMHEVAHSYFPKNLYKTEEDQCWFLNNRYETTEALQNLYRSHTNEEIIGLDLADLPAWNMPGRTYSLICGNTQIFCIDSNTYVSEYLKFCEGYNNEHNQPLWLKQEVDKAREERRQVILALHHPPVTPGKRAFDNDFNLYLSESEINSKTFDSHFGHLIKSKGLSYNQLIRETFIQQKLEFDVVLTAHDHDMYYYNNKDTPDDYPLCQFTAGGGGGDLQKRADFSEQKNMGCFLKRHGFTEVRCPTEGPIEFFLRTIPKSDKDRAFLLHFNSNNCDPMRIYPEKMNGGEIENITNFCKVVMSAINEYLAFLAPLQAESGGEYLSIKLWKGGNTEHGYHGVERAHKIWAYLSQHYADDYNTTVENVYLMSRWDNEYTSPKPDSLITVLNKKIAEYYDGHSMESFYKREENISGFTLL
jgi:Calcineurin-like phosphoesterase